MNDDQELERLQQALRLSEQQAKFRHDASHAALHAIVKELAIRAGLSEDEFQRNFDARRNHYHDRFLKGIEDLYPHRAAEFDDRALPDVPTAPGFPPLFP